MQEALKVSYFSYLNISCLNGSFCVLYVDVHKFSYKSFLTAKDSCGGDSGGKLQDVIMMLYADKSEI